uniref:Endoglucanase n=1 Tax=Saccoglossus kowalevskii TaxID=10224 RepID=A0ABM0N1F2_SACKO|nr:PREDICTED: endoglucanase 15-like [Saccoglossus kowalevskii]
MIGAYVADLDMIKLDLYRGYDYTEVIHQSILFYEAQRSGDIPEETNRIPYRGDSALDDQGFYGEDLTGGWYDAGDNVKFGQPMAASMTNLAWGMIQFEDAYRAANAWNYGLDGIRWAANYFVKCHVEDNKFYYQVGNPGLDHSYWGRPEEMTAERPALMINSSVPGSDIAGDTAAALAVASIIFSTSDPAYAAILLNHAEILFEFAINYPGNHPANGYYQPTEYGDELGLAACWLYLATGNELYLQNAEDLYVAHRLFRKSWAYGWSAKNPAVQVLLYQITGKIKYYNSLTNYVDSWLPNATLPYTPGGLVHRHDWGSLRYSANTAFIALIAAENGVKTAEYQDFAKAQIHYMLGDSGRSYVIGYGVNPPDRPHHRSSSCPDQPSACNWSSYGYDGPNPQVLYGGLVGGPDINDYWTQSRFETQTP